MNYNSVKIREIRQHQAKFFGQLKAKRKPYYKEINGIKLIILPDVFPVTTDSKLMVGNIRVSKNERILDLGTGCGLFAVIAGMQGATGIAVDINPEAVRNANENFKRFRVEMKATHFSAVKDLSANSFQRHKNI